MAETRLDIADELLVAYADGELDAERRALVAAALERNQALAERLERFVLSRELLREAFPCDRHTPPVPEGIRAAMARLAAAGSESADRVVTAAFGERARVRQQSITARVTAKAARGSRWVSAIAASLAIFALSGALTYVASQAREHRQTIVQADAGLIVRDNPLYAVLESAPSSHFVPLDGARLQARSVLTFRGRDGGYCREFEVIAGAAVSTGLACRSQDHWRTQILLTGIATGADAGPSYQPAAGPDEQAIEAVIERLMLGDPLSAAEESRLLSAGWK